MSGFVYHPIAKHGIIAPLLTRNAWTFSTHCSAVSFGQRTAITWRFFWNTKLTRRVLDKRIAFEGAAFLIGAAISEATRPVSAGSAASGTASAASETASVPQSTKAPKKPATSCFSTCLYTLRIQRGEADGRESGRPPTRP